MMSKTLAQEAGAYGVRVLCIAPGAIRTAINAEVWQDAAGQQDLISKIAIGRVGEPQDMAGMAVVLASDVAGYVTGTSVFVDGGMTDYPAFSHGGYERDSTDGENTRRRRRVARRTTAGDAAHALCGSMSRAARRSVPGDRTHLVLERQGLREHGARRLAAVGHGRARHHQRDLLAIHRPAADPRLRLLSGRQHGAGSI
jgi:hypothetical protein